MKIYKLFTIILFLVVKYSVFAQEKIISGTIKDELQQPIPGVTVKIKNTNQGTSSDFDGNFSIKAHQDDVLVFSFIGMKEKELKVLQDTSRVDVILQNDVQQLEETVVIGYGSGKKITAVTGSVSQIKMSDYAQAPSANAFDVLQGKVAGLQIVSTSGEPGQGANIVLHGQGSIKGFFDNFDSITSPLFVLDGIPVSSSVALSMNASDFESVTVLKDASATSIYGTRAANGVIYITSKKGKKGEKSSITINTQIGFSNLYSRKFYESFMNSQEYMDYWVERGAITRDRANQILNQYPYDTRWDEFYFKKNTPTSQTSVSISGGSEKMNYYLSAGHFNQRGIMYRSGYERYTLSGNLDAQLNNWLKIGVNISTGTNENSSAYNSGVETPLLTLPLYSFVDKDGNKLDYIDYIYKTRDWRGRERDVTQRLFNPEFLADKNPATSQTQEIIPIGYLSIEPIENLIFKTQGGIQYNITEGDTRVLPSLFEVNPQSTAMTRRTMSKDLSKTLTNTLEYKFQLGKKHNFTALLGQESISQTTSGFYASSQGQLYDALTMLRHGNEQKEVEDSKIVTTYNSYFSRLDYNFGGKYFIDISARRDGASNFGKNNKYADFWALGLLWRAKDEAFLRNVDWLDLLNVRFSTGTSGHSGVSHYSHLTKISSDLRYNGGQGYTIDRIGNPNLQWESQHKTNVGIDLGLFKSVAFEVDLYRRITSNMLFSEAIPSYTGFSSYEKNSAKLQNQGIDVTFSFTVFNDFERKISIRPYLNFNYNTQKVLEVYSSAYKNPIVGDVMLKEGEAIMYAFPIFKGVNSETGEPLWYEPNADPTIMQTNDNQTTSVYTRENLKQNTGKKAQAPFNGGFGLSASYGGFALQVGFSFSEGKYMKNLDKVTMETPTVFGQRNLSKNAANYWKQVGDVAEFPSVNYVAIQPDSRILEDASFIRLKDVNLSYTLGKKYIEQIGFFEGIRFFATGRNLLTFTKFSGADPEFKVSAVQGGYPSMKQYSFGVEVKF